MTRLLVELVLLTALVGCRARSKLDDIILYYSESNTFCVGCPKFRVDFRDGGHINYECLGDCAVPGEQHHLVPAQRFRELVQAFHNAGFFGIPRTDRGQILEDFTVIRLTYCDERKTHEVVDGLRQIPQLTNLETRLKAATEVDRYLKPSLALFRRLADSGWDVNTLGPDHQSALVSAVISRDLESTRSCCSADLKLPIGLLSSPPCVKMSIFFVLCFRRHTSGCPASVAQPLLGKPRAVGRQI